MVNHQLGITAILNVIAYILWSISVRFDVAFLNWIVACICIVTTIVLLIMFAHIKRVTIKTRIHYGIQLFVSIGIILAMIFL